MMSYYQDIPEMKFEVQIIYTMQYLLNFYKPRTLKNIHFPADHKVMHRTIIDRVDVEDRIC